jgi:hypothetical protein
MKTASRLLLAFLLITLGTQCVQPTMGGYAIGQRSRAINEGRSDSRAITSEARLSQNRRQRANELEESRAQREMRANDRDEALGPLKTVREAASLVRGIGFGF